MPDWKVFRKHVQASLNTGAYRNSAELKEPRKRLRIRPEIFDFEPDLGLKLGQTKPNISGTVPTNRHTTIPNDSAPIVKCFDHDPKLLNSEIAQSGPFPGTPRGEGGKDKNQKSP